MTTIQTTIQQLLDEAVQSGAESGAQVTAYRHGELLVDAWSGEGIGGDTLFPVFSTTKGIAATVIHLLAERGQLDYDTPVAQVWPEFAQNGKEQITLRQCLNHTAGLPNLPQGLSWEQLHDWDAMCAALAKEAPAWPPGSRREYHAVTYGWLVGEVARRVDGRPFAQIVHEEICAPLGITTLFCGVPAGREGDVAKLQARDVEIPDLEENTPAPVPRWLWPLHEMMNRSDARRACQPASNGIMNARAIARHYAALLPGGVDGVELLPPSRIKIATTYEEPPMESPLKVALGYMVGGDGSPMGGPAAFGHGGHGGSLGFADPESGLAFGFTRSLFSSTNVLGPVLEALRAELGQAS